MATASKKTPPKRESATTPKDVKRLRIQMAFDVIYEALAYECYSNVETKKAVELINWTRHHTDTVFKAHAV